MTKKEIIQELIKRTTSIIQKPKYKEYTYVGIIRWNGIEFRYPTAYHNFSWSDTQSVREILTHTYKYSKISSIEAAPSLEDVISKNYFDIEKFETGSGALIERYSDNSD
ncbi:hypothetical protein ACQW08_04565 [Gluconobacter japonicus]|uniref:hypothetical protein n=1 Tax=Gluconobacter japonicus TaxID=376620 RepID=UPI003D2BFF23